MDLIPLRNLGSGEVGQISELVGLPDEVRRLEELGLRRGASVEMVQPGHACIVRVAGSKFCFRESELFTVLVRLGATS